MIGGNSLGGHVALEMALSHRDRVSGLILTGSSGLFERTFTRGVPHRPSEAYVRQKMEEIFFDPRLVTPEWVESVRRTVTTPASALRVLRFARAAKRHNIEDRLAAIDAPALLVWGRDDRITPPEVAERFQALLPDSHLTFLPRCGHAPMLEQPDAFNEAVAGVVNGYAGPARRGRGGSRPVIARVVAPVLDWYAGRRRRALEAVWRALRRSRRSPFARCCGRRRTPSSACPRLPLHPDGGAVPGTRVPVREYADFSPSGSARWRERPVSRGPGAAATGSRRRGPPPATR